MKTILVFLLILLMVLGAGCAVEEEVEKKVVEEKSIEEEAKGETKEAINIFDLRGLTDGEVLDLIGENYVTWDDVTIYHFVFEEENILVEFNEDKEVAFVTVWEGNEVLGVEISGDYDEKKITEKLGPPLEKGTFDWEGEEVRFVLYCADKYTWITFCENFRFPFEAIMKSPGQPCLPEFFVWPEEDVRQFFEEKAVDLYFEEGKLVEIEYFEGGYFGVQVGDKYEDIVEKIFPHGQPEISAAIFSLTQTGAYMFPRGKFQRGQTVNDNKVICPLTHAGVMYVYLKDGRVSSIIIVRLHG